MYGSKIYILYGKTVFSAAEKPDNTGHFRTKPDIVGHCQIKPDITGQNQT